MKFFSASDFNNLRLLCLGDVMLDRFINGHVERISPEGPIPILRYTQESLMLGGAGNVVRNMVALGGQCHFLTHIGDDEVGRIVEQKLMEEERITFRLLKTALPTSQISIIVDGNDGHQGYLCRIWRAALESRHWL